MRCEQFLRQHPARGATRSATAQWHRLAHWHTAVWPVHVQVLHDDEPGARRGRTSQDATLQWRELLWPAVVIRSVGAVVDVRRSSTNSARILRVRRVSTHHFDGFRQRAARAAARRDTDPLAAAEQSLDNRRADWSGTEDNVEFGRIVHGVAVFANDGAGCSSTRGLTPRISSVTP